MKADTGFDYAGVKPAATIANCSLHTANWDIACGYHCQLVTANCFQIPGALHRATLSDPFGVNSPNIFF